MKIVFLEVDKDDQHLVEEAFPEATISQHAFTPEVLVEKCQDAEVISCFIYTKFTRDIVKQLPNLKLLCTRSVGYNHIDLEACKEQGITVCNVPDYGSHVIAEHVFALLLSTLRHIAKADDAVEEGEFDYHGLRGMALRGKRLGIVGTGKIGRRVAEIAHGFGMHILATDKCRTVELEDLLHVQYVSLETLLAESDIITLHVPAIRETTHMIDTSAFESMRDGVVLVNTARGELIDSEALLQALQSGKVAHALLDVLEHEKNFEENKELIEHPNVVTTPHIAFYADDSMHNMYEDVFMSIREWQSGEGPQHTVHPVEVVCDLKGVSSK